MGMSLFSDAHVFVCRAGIRHACWWPHCCHRRCRPNMRLLCRWPPTCMHVCMCASCLRAQASTHTCMHVCMDDCAVGLRPSAATWPACVQVGMLAMTPTQLFPYKRPATPFPTWKMSSLNDEVRRCVCTWMDAHMPRYTAPRQTCSLPSHTRNIDARGACLPACMHAPSPPPPFVPLCGLPSSMAAAAWPANTSCMA